MFSATSKACVSPEDILKPGHLQSGISVALSPYPAEFKMIGWNVADAKRKFIFIGLGFLSILILFSRARRTDRVTEWVDYSKLKSRYGLSGDTSSSFFGSGLIFRGGASLVRARMGPVLRNGKRRLSRQSLTDLRNDTLGVPRFLPPLQMHCLLTRATILVWQGICHQHERA